jgi:hypothetical protein
VSTRGWHDVSASDIARMQRKAPQGAKRSKFGNVKVQAGGHSWDSKKEYEHWLSLQARAKAGEITDLDRQVRFELVVPDRVSVLAPNVERLNLVVGVYLADFVFTDHAGVRHVQDVKGGNATKTALYRWKVKHLELQDGITVEEI